ncbi:hypothetical protein SprV_0401602900 [Sparganum proliferum]
MPVAVAVIVAITMAVVIAITVAVFVAITMAVVIAITVAVFIAITMAVVIAITVAVFVAVTVAVLVAVTVAVVMAGVAVAIVVAHRLDGQKDQCSECQQPHIVEPTWCRSQDRYHLYHEGILRSMSRNALAAL